MMNTPVEMLEMAFPLRVEEYSLIPDSGGAGTWRGGLGARRVWRVLGHEAHAAVCCERTLTPPFGLAGGLSGGPMRLWLELPDGAVQRLNSKGSFPCPPELVWSWKPPVPAGTARRRPATTRSCARTALTGT